MGTHTARQVLADNLKALMSSPDSPCSTDQAVETATSQKGHKIGRSTVQRMRAGITPVNLDFIEVLAKVFSLEPWQLLAPDLGKKSATAAPDLKQSLKGLGLQLERVPLAFQKSAAALLENLATAPRAHERVLAALLPLIEAGEELKEPADPFELGAAVWAPKRPGNLTAAERRSGPKKQAVNAPIYYGDGNKKQRALPFALKSKDELKVAAPTVSEKQLWDKIEAYPKADEGDAHAQNRSFLRRNNSRGHR